MTTIFEKDVFTQADIEEIVNNETEESLNLDFKAGDSLGKNDGKKKEITKDVSAFANSDGGLIVYGITEKDHKASSFTFVDGNEFTKEWLEQVIQSGVHRKIESLRIFPVRFDFDVKKTVYVVKIPQSRNCPHQATDRRFYKRYNFESVPMEEYEIRRLYFNNPQTELNIPMVISRSSSCSGSKNSKFGYIEFILTFQVENIGGTIEKDYKNEISIPSNTMKGNLSPNPIQIFHVRNEDGLSVFSVPAKAPIFQDERTSVETAIIKIDRKNFPAETDSIIQKLYFSCGIKERRFPIHELLIKDNDKLEKDDFRKE